MLYKTHERTSDNTMAKTNKDKQCYTKHIAGGHTIPWTKPTRTNNIIQNFYITLFFLVGFGHDIV
jgi:carboxypeptidase C (cathepsin A)